MNVFNLQSSQEARDGFLRHHRYLMQEHCTRPARGEREAREGEIVYLFQVTDQRRRNDVVSVRNESILYQLCKWHSPLVSVSE